MVDNAVAEAMANVNVQLTLTVESTSTWNLALGKAVLALADEMMALKGSLARLGQAAECVPALSRARRLDPTMQADEVHSRPSVAGSERGQDNYAAANLNRHAGAPRPAALVTLAELVAHEEQQQQQQQPEQQQNEQQQQYQPPHQRSQARATAEQAHSSLSHYHTFHSVSTSRHVQHF